MDDRRHQLTHSLMLHVAGHIGSFFFLSSSFVLLLLLFCARRISAACCCGERHTHRHTTSRPYRSVVCMRQATAALSATVVFMHLVCKPPFRTQHTTHTHTSHKYISFERILLCFVVRISSLLLHFRLIESHTHTHKH